MRASGLASEHLFPGAPDSAGTPDMRSVQRRITANGYSPYAQPAIHRWGLSFEK